MLISILLTGLLIYKMDRKEKALLSVPQESKELVTAHVHTADPIGAIVEPVDGLFVALVIDTAINGSVVVDVDDILDVRHAPPGS